MSATSQIGWANGHGQGLSRPRAQSIVTNLHMSGIKDWGGGAFTLPRPRCVGSFCAGAEAKMETDH